MSIRKMRDISEATAPRAEPLDPENLRVAFELSITALRLHPRDRVRGVHRCRSIHEANEAKRDGAR